MLFVGKQRYKCIVVEMSTPRSKDRSERDSGSKGDCSEPFITGLRSIGQRIVLTVAEQAKMRFNALHIRIDFYCQKIINTVGLRTRL